MSIINQVLTIKSVPNCENNFVFKNPITEIFIEGTFNNSISIRVRHSDCNCDTKPICDWFEYIFNRATNPDRLAAELTTFNSDGSVHTAYLKLFPMYVDGVYIEFHAKIIDFKITKKPNPNISWDEYFMSVAKLTSMRSKDMNTKVGAVLVDSKNRIIGTGYNGLPSHIDESKFPTSNNKSLPYNETKYAYVAHAELNSILNTTVYNLTDSKIYCTLFPCNECAKLLFTVFIIHFF